MSDGWKARAACKGTPLRLWFHPHDGRHNYRRDCLRCAEALDVCCRCDVRERCLVEALSRRTQHGVQGGLDARQREKLKQQRRRKGWA